MIWRLILDGAAPGAWNMAVDEALLLSHAAGAVPPTLRFYDWQPACVSLGRLQKLDDTRGLNIAAIKASGFDMVRRPTGGRAVLHQHEITYSIVLSMDLLPFDCRAVVSSYAWLNRGFTAGLHDLGLDGMFTRSAADTSAAGAANCFSSAAQCDFLVADKKLIGSAQYRRRGVILQHGSLLLDVDRAAWQAALGGAMERTTSLRELGVTHARAEVIAALCAGMERTVPVSLQQAVLDAPEMAVATRLHTEKYSAVI